MKQSVFFIILILSFLPFNSANKSAFARSELIKIEIIKVYDGDTVRAKTTENKEISIRLIGIDCFEVSLIDRAYKQAYLENLSIEEVLKRGIESKKILHDFFKTNNNDIFLESHGLDKYGRTLGILYSGNMNINKYMKCKGKCPKYIYKGK